MRDFLKLFFANYQATPHWDVERMPRHKVMLPKILEMVTGDILEIGAHRGDSTRMFCEIAEKFGRKVYVIDPWDGRQEGNNDVYGEFLANTAHCKNLVVYRMGSEKPEAFEAVKDIKLAFLFIDGMHAYDAVVSDFTKFRKLLSDKAVICIDDWTGPYDFCHAIRTAVLDHMNSEFEEIQAPGSLIEKYIVRL
jgi:cephalosporin hydroxylase